MKIAIAQQPNTLASDMFDDFRENLGSGWLEIDDPWKMQKGSNSWANTPAVKDASVDLDYLHRNHLHIALKK